MTDPNKGKLVKTKKILHAYGHNRDFLTKIRVPLKSGTFLIVPIGTIGLITETVINENRIAGYRVCIFSLGITNFVNADAVEIIT